MKTLIEVEDKAQQLECRINDLTEQKEVNARKGNWTVVKAIKEQLRPLQAEYDTLCWILGAGSTK